MILQYLDKVAVYAIVMGYYLMNGTLFLEYLWNDASLQTYT